MSDLTHLRHKADAAEAQLRSAVEIACPGPHEPKQHRDRKPPWCEACNRTARGVHRLDITRSTTRKQAPS